MKSPLVEALRQANDSNATSARDESDAHKRAVDRPTDAAVADRMPDPEELKLMESTGLLRADCMEHSVEGGPLSCGATGLDGANDEMRSDDAPGSHAVPSSRSRFSGTRGRARIASVGLFSPLICLALGFAAAGAYFTFQSVSGWYHNSDLESLSSQSASGQSLANRFPTHEAENRLALIVRPELPVRSSPGVAADEAVVPSTDQQTPPALEEATRRSGFDDRAFGALNDAFRAYERGDYAAAETAYRRALELAPRHPNALQGLAAILQRTGRVRESLQFYEMLLAVDPGNPAAAAALLAERGGAAPAAGESDVKLLIQQHPESAPLQFALGALLAGQSRWADARHAFDQAVRLDAGNADYLFNLAVSLEHLGQNAEARYFYESALDAAGATSTLDLDVVIARIEKLTQPSNSESLPR